MWWTVLACGVADPSPTDPSDPPVDSSAPAHSGPGCVAEVPYDGVDQDCDGADLVDVDDDGHDGVPAGGDDCDDTDDAVAPGFADPAGDGVDADCDGVDGPDADGDGVADWRSGGLDCDDTDPSRYTGATEVWYDGVDTDCDRACDHDQDGDGAVPDGTVVLNGDRCDPTPGPLVVVLEDCDDLDPAVTFVGLIGTAPPDGAVDVAVDAVVVASLGAADPTAVITLTGEGGDPVAGTSTAGGTTVTFTPAAPLAFGQRHTATVSWVCDTVAADFRTEEARVPVDPADLVGVNYELNLTTATWVEPAGIGPLLSLVGLEPVYLGVVTASADELALRLAVGSPQDLCTPTTEVAAVSFVDNPAMAFGPATLTLDLGGYPVGATDVTLSADLSPAALTAGVLEADLDTRPLVDLLVPGGPADAVCTLITTFGVSCGACPDGSGTYCLHLRAEDVGGPSGGAPLVLVTAADVAADPTCP